MTDTITITLAEDAYKGDAQCTVAIDGVESGPYTVTALHPGASQDVSITGDWAHDQAHSVAVTFINDAYGGTPDQDRNLYVLGVAFNGARLAPFAPAELYSSRDTTRFVLPAGMVAADYAGQIAALAARVEALEAKPAPDVSGEVQSIINAMTRSVGAAHTAVTADTPILRGDSGTTTWRELQELLS